MAHAKIKPTPAALMKYRAVENISPGAWWLGTYEDDEGNNVEMWTQVNVAMSGVQIATGRKIEHVLGTCTDGEPAELRVYRGTQMPSLTERDGIRCGLTIEPTIEEGESDG